MDVVFNSSAASFINRMWSDEIPYTVSGSEKVKNIEEDLQRELAELKNELEENEMVHGITRTIRY